MGLYGEEEWSTFTEVSRAYLFFGTVDGLIPSGIVAWPLLRTSRQFFQYTKSDILVQDSFAKAVSHGAPGGGGEPFLGVQNQPNSGALVSVWLLPIMGNEHTNSVPLCRNLQAPPPHFLQSCLKRPQCS